MQRYPYQVYFFHLLTLCNCSYSLYPSTISAVLIHEKPYEGVTIFSTYKNRDRVTHLCGQGVVLLRIIAVNSEGLTMTFTVYSCYNFVLHQKSFICTFFTPYITKIILFSNEVPGIGSWKSSHPYLVDQNNWSFSCKNNVVEKFYTNKAGSKYGGKKESWQAVVVRNREGCQI